MGQRNQFYTRSSKPPVEVVVSMDDRIAPLAYEGAERDAYSSKGEYYIKYCNG